MQHQTQGIGSQDLTAGRNNSLKFSLSKSAGKVGGGQQTVENPSILRPSAMGITSLLNESLTNNAANLQKRTLMMLNHLQGFQNHHFNPAVGLIFSNSGAHHPRSSSNAQRGLSPQTDGPRNQNMRATSENAFKKTISTPIEDHFNSNQNILVDRAELKKSLIEGLPEPRLLRKSHNLLNARQTTEHSEHNTTLGDHS